MKGRYLFALIAAAVCLALAVPHATTANHLMQAGGNGPLDDDLAKANSRASVFLRDVVNGRTDEALNDLLIDSPLERDPEKLTQLNYEIGQLEMRFGEFLRGEKLILERIGGSMIRGVYLLHCQRFPIVWRITFYRDDATGDWVVISLSYDTQYDKLPAVEPPRVGGLP